MPSQPYLADLLQGLVNQLNVIYNEYQATQYASINVVLASSGQGFWVRDFWFSGSPANGGIGPGGGSTQPAFPINSVKAAAVITPTTTATQCGTIATNMLAAIAGYATATNPMMTDDTKSFTGG